MTALDEPTHEKEARHARFMDDSRFASVVRTCGGDGLLIGGIVIHVQSPERNHVEWIAEALRRARWPEPVEIETGADDPEPEPEGEPEAVAE